ncbi:hypothetical protein [Enterococcus sp. AZ103]|uniref:hypothetical protein n=1 Tax=Enterococcus sp. AZ103 TaxID=2774628 RepID=UPI003F687E94
MNKELKKQQRFQLLAVMELNPDWIVTEKDLKKIQDLAEPLFHARPSFPSVKNDWATFKRSDFLFLLSFGYDTKDISKIYKVGSQRVNVWKKDQGFYGKAKDEMLEMYSDEIVKVRKQKNLSDYGISN